MSCEFDSLPRNDGRILPAAEKRARWSGNWGLAITSLSHIRPTWWEMQRIKDELAGHDATAVEIQPPSNEIVDGAEMYHLWVVTTPMPSLWHARANNLISPQD